MKWSENMGRGRGRGEIRAAFQWGHLSKIGLLEDKLTWENTTKTDIKVLEWVGLGWINLVQNKENRQSVVNPTMNVPVT
jgi:hypothetical protein